MEFFLFRGDSAEPVRFAYRNVVGEAAFMLETLLLVLLLFVVLFVIDLLLLVFELLVAFNAVVECLNIWNESTLASR